MQTAISKTPAPAVMIDRRPNFLAIRFLISTCIKCGKTTSFVPVVILWRGDSGASQSAWPPFFDFGQHPFARDDGVE